MSKVQKPEIHIPRSESPEEVLFALANSSTLRDRLISMESTAELIRMLDQIEDTNRQRLLEQCTDNLKLQISEIRLMLQEIKEYLNERNISDTTIILND